jgi:hypothetical protein
MYARARTTTLEILPKIPCPCCHCPLPPKLSGPVSSKSSLFARVRRESAAHWHQFRLSDLCQTICSKFTTATKATASVRTVGLVRHHIQSLIQCFVCTRTMRLQLSRNFIAENSESLYWDYLLFRGGLKFSLRINWKRIVPRERPLPRF